MKKSIACITAGVILGILLLNPIKAEAAKPQTTIELSYEDAQLLMRIGQAEAGNQGTTGMWLVMCVILNRVDSPEWPDTISEVIYQPRHQFTTPADIEDVTVEAHLALARLEMGYRISDIVAFERKESNILDSYFDLSFIDQDHKFYKEKAKP